MFNLATLGITIQQVKLAKLTGPDGQTEVIAVSVNNAPLPTSIETIEKLKGAGWTITMELTALRLAHKSSHIDVCIPVVPSVKGLPAT